jgi:hypothetical protein
MAPLKIAFTGLLLSLLLALGACQNPNNVTALIYLAKTVIQLIDTFSEKSDGFTDRVRKVTAMTTSSINENKDIGDIAKFWEKQWLDIHARFDDLEAHLHAINMKSLEYFQELDNNNALISDERLKAQDAAKTQEIKLKWQQEYQKAAASMENTKKMLKRLNMRYKMFTFNRFAVKKQSLPHSPDCIRGYSCSTASRLKNMRRRKKK